MTDDDAKVAKANQNKKPKKKKKGYSFLASVQCPFSSLYSALFSCFGWLAIAVAGTPFFFLLLFCFYGAEDGLSETSPEDAG